MADAPRLRQWNEDPPHYDDPDKFTLSLEHNGFFCGMRENLCYATGTGDCFDYCSVDTFSRLWIEDFVQQLGHPITPRMRFYWSPPGKALHEGLVCIQSDADIVAMTSSLQDQEQKLLNVLVDHTNFLQPLRPDMVVQAQPALPLVPSPQEVVKKRRISEESSTSAVTNEQAEDEDEEEDAEDEGTDSEFYDSDYDAEDGDDDIFEAHVDKDVDDHNEKLEIVEHEDDGGLENEDITLTNEQKLRLKYKFSTFNPEVDFENPEFKIGIVFSCMKELRTALTVYSIRKRVKLEKSRNTATRLNANCSWEGCTWFIKAAQDSRKQAIVVKKYEAKHTCESVWELKVLIASFLTQFFMDEFRDNQKMDLATFANKVNRRFSMCPSRFKLGRARKEALARIHGDEADQFKQLRDYGYEMCTRNPGSTFYLSTNHSKDSDELEPKEHLATLYWSYDAFKRGFLKGCRPFICIDGKRRKHAEEQGLYELMFGDEQAEARARHATLPDLNAPITDASQEEVQVTQNAPE